MPTPAQDLANRMNNAFANLDLDRQRIVVDFAEYIGVDATVDAGALGSAVTPGARIKEVTSEGVAAPVTWPSKDPDEVLDYGLDWAGRLNDGDTIKTSNWIDRGQLGLFLEWHHPTDTRVWVKGGEAGKTYFVTNRVVTNVGRVMDQTVTISIVKAR
jgi:hypothetical protein